MAVNVVNIWKCMKCENIKGIAQEYLAFHVCFVLLFRLALVHDWREKQGRQASDSLQLFILYFFNSSIIYFYIFKATV